MAPSSRRIAITGGYGFLGWHTACRLRAIYGIEPLRLGRDDFADPRTLSARLADVDTVIHAAGVNRADTVEEVEDGNTTIASALTDAIEQTGDRIDIVYANSIQADLDNPYGRGKSAAARILADSTSKIGSRFSDIMLPNLFGEHGRPHYNSFVATFAHEIAAGRRPSVTSDRDVPLMHAQDAASALIEAALGTAIGRTDIEVTPVGVGDVLNRLVAMHDVYARGEIPNLGDHFDVSLFNTYRAALFPQPFPVSPVVNEDTRGRLFETVRSHGGTGQAFVSTTVPGQKRGDHYHLRKVERFFVIKGEAEISLRRLLHDEVVTFRLRGNQPSFVDMPTLWVHDITNVGDDELVTMFWTDQLLDPDNPDQFPEQVRRKEGEA